LQWPRQSRKGRTIKLLIANQQIRVIDLQGQLIRELTLDPTRNYQPAVRQLWLKLLGSAT
jgi:hypothetical protein